MPEWIANHRIASKSNAKPTHFSIFCIGVQRIFFVLLRYSAIKLPLVHNFFASFAVQSFLNELPLITFAVRQPIVGSDSMKIGYNE